MTKSDQKVYIAVALVLGFLTGFIAGKSSYTNDVQKIVQNISDQGTVSVTNTAPADDKAAPAKDEVTLMKEKYAELKIFNGSATEAPYLGEANAPITIVEYSDFQCPYCSTFFKKTLPSIVENYVKTGKVKFVYKDFPLSGHANAVPAAIATHCAGEQNAYWYMHDMLFDHQAEWSRLEVLDAESEFLTYAKRLELDTDKFSTCQAGDAYNKIIQDGFAEGVKLGVDGTPGFDIGGELVVGAHPYAKFDQTIKAQLTSK